LSLLGFVIYYGRSLFNANIKEDNTLTEVGWWFFISCLANSLWVVVWLYEYTLISVFLMIVLLFSLLKIVVKTTMESHHTPLKKNHFSLLAILYLFRLGFRGAHC